MAPDGEPQRATRTRVPRVAGRSGLGKTKLVTMVQGETSTGVVQPLEEIGHGQSGGDFKSAARALA